MAGKSAVTLRLGVEGDEKIQAALRKIGQTGDAAMQGLSREADAQRVLDLATERHRRLTGAVNDNAKATGLARHEWINLSRQFQDVGVSLAGGQSPLLVMMQQGSQIADVFGSSGAGAGAALRSFGAGARCGRLPRRSASPSN